MSRSEDALQALYEDSSLRDELRDEEADELLEWAESELTKLESAAADDGAFEEKVGELRRLLRGMNRLVGRRDQISAQAGDDTLVKLTTHANALGYALTPDQLAQFAGEQAGLDAKSAIQKLTSLIGATGTPVHAHAEVPTASDKVQSTPPEPPPELPPQRPTPLASLLGALGINPPAAAPPTPDPSAPDTEDRKHDQTFD